MASFYLSLNGTSSDYIQSTNSDIFSNANLATGSIEFWMKVADYPAGNKHIFSSEGYVTVYIDSSGQINGFSDGSGTATVTSSVISKDVWHLVEFNWTTTSDSDIFIDGVNTDGSAPGGSPNLDSVSRKTSYGSQYDGGGLWFTGDLGPIRVSSIRRNTSTYTPSGFNSGFSSDGNALMIWNLNEGTGTALADATGNDKTGVITGSTWHLFIDNSAFFAFL